MIVLIPSYKRTDILRWVIQSVVQSDTQGINERIMILVVNNYFPNKEIVDSIVAQFRFEGKFECEVIHRKETLPAVESWFSAIFSKADDDEVVALLGDDDIMLPWGLKYRYQQIMEQKADMMLSDFCQRLYFFNQGERCCTDIDMLPSPPEDKQGTVWESLPEEYPRATFISNHCYRNTAKFKKGLETALAWCDAQDWVLRDFATGNLPGYLPYAIKSTGGLVISLSEKSVIRGLVADEVQFQDYADGGNTSFYCLLIYNTFSNPGLHDDIAAFSDICRVHLRCFFAGIIGVLFNKKITLGMLQEAIRRSGIKVRDFLTWDLLNNYYAMFRLLPWIRGYRLKRTLKSSHLLSTRDFILDLIKG